MDIKVAEDILDRLERLDRYMESCLPTFKFSKDHMRLVTSIFLFIRATREVNWNIHLESQSIVHTTGTITFHGTMIPGIDGKAEKSHPGIDKK